MPLAFSKVDSGRISLLLPGSGLFSRGKLDTKGVFLINLIAIKKRDI